MYDKYLFNRAFKLRDNGDRYQLSLPKLNHTNATSMKKKLKHRQELTCKIELAYIRHHQPTTCPISHENKYKWEAENTRATNISHRLRRKTSCATFAHV